MQVVCKRYTEIPHTSHLFGDFLYHFERVADLYRLSPHDPESYRISASAIDYPDERRRELVASLFSQNGASENLTRLAQPGTVAVVTGQQVGIFSGPAYTIYKALTAVRLAQELTRTGIEAVPVFWLATEDHDLAEVSSCWSLNANHDPVHLRLDIPTQSSYPVGNIALQGLPLKELTASLQQFPFGEEISALVTNAYQDGRTYGESFRRLSQALLAKYGLLFFDPMHPSSRRLGAPFLAKAVDAAPDLNTLLLDRNRQLEQRGYHAQVHIEPHTSLFFLLQNGERIALRRKDGAFYHKDRRIEPAELKDKAEALSPNALLRPVVQDFMIPTVAYIGGPAELAYLAQSAVLYERLLGRMPVAVPRNGFTLIEEKSRKLLERHQLKLDSFFQGEEALRDAIARRLVPPSVKAGFEATAAVIGDQSTSLRKLLEPFDSTLGKSLDKSTAKIRYQLEKMERKIMHESLRRNQRAQHDAHYLYNLLYPHKHLQERFYTILPFLAQHGMELIDTLYSHMHPDCPDHHILYL